jgi:fructose/tagatose bisphosphate aldolase
MNSTLAEVLDLSGSRPILRDAWAVRGGIEEIVRLAVFGTEDEKALARYAIHSAAPQLGAVSSSIWGLYRARGRGEVSGFTAPAVNIRGMAFDMSRALFRAMKATNGAATIFELARSEMGYTFQEPSEIAAVVLAAAIAEGYEGPVFIQGDHFQANAKKFATDPESETKGLEDLIRKAVAAQFYCIDIDASTLVDLSFEKVADQQAPNAKLTARLTKLVRELEPEGVTISVGGEIGEVGKENSTVEELTEYVDGFRGLVGADEPGLAKVSVQTGTSHGGIPLPDGTIASVAIDFETLRELSRVGRERYGMAGAVQHGASTDDFRRFMTMPSTFESLRSWSTRSRSRREVLPARTTTITPSQRWASTGAFIEWSVAGRSMTTNRLARFMLSMSATRFSERAERAGSPWLWPAGMTVMCEFTRCDTCSRLCAPVSTSVRPEVAPRPNSWAIEVVWKSLSTSVTSALKSDASEAARSSSPMTISGPPRRGWSRCCGRSSARSRGSAGGQANPGAAHGRAARAG